MEEKHYLGAKNYQGSVYYCSWECFNKQLDKQEKEDFSKGNCASCGQYLVVINDKCQDIKHKREAHYFPIKGKVEPEGEKHD
jgi:hypothetical protein